MKTLIENVNILDLEKDEIREENSILIEEERIGEISSEISEDSNQIEVYDAEGKYAIPSFIDMHTHITFPGRSHLPIREFEYREDEKYAVSQGSQNLMEALLSGVCLLRDLGSIDEKVNSLRNYKNKNKIIGPEILTSGSALIPEEDAHGNDFGTHIDSTSKARKVVEEKAEKGYEWIKVMNGPELFDIEVLSAIVDKAHELSLKVSVHAFTEKGIKDAIKSGADTIEHSLVFDEETLKLARENNTKFVPTYYCAWFSLRDQFTKGVPEEELKHLKDWWKFLQENFQFHKENKINLLAGTDAGFAPCNFVDIKDEIKMFHHKGLSATQALKTATIEPAKALGKEQNYGSIEKGKYANFIILEEDPRENLDTLDNYKGVWYKGADILNYLNRPWK